MKQLIQNKDTRERIKRRLATALFLVILVKVFVSATYLFRNADDDRLRVVGIKEEEPLDMVYIGSSAAFHYWQPLKAWNDCGFASYNIGTSMLCAESIKYYLEQALRFHNPQLIVIDVRPFQYYGTFYEVPVRLAAAGLDFSVDGIKMVNECLENYDIDDSVDKLSMYFDIAKYHTNLTILQDDLAWKLIDNREIAHNKGFTWLYDYRYCEEPEDFFSEERQELPAGSEEILLNLLNYCRDEELNVLFVAVPYHISAEEYAQFNYLQDIVISYGFDFLNANAYYDEIGIDFSMDYYDRAHVNCFGAEKYTQFMEAYIEEHYDLPDHRENAVYESWNQDAIRFTGETESVKIDTAVLIREVQDGRVIADRIAESTDFLEWCSLAGNSCFTVIANGNTEEFDLSSVIDREAFSFLGLDIPADGETNYFRIVSGQKIVYSNSGTGETNYTASLGRMIWNPSQIILDNSNMQASIVIDGKEYSRKDEGINLVVFENDYHYVVDSITIRCNDAGEIELVR